MLRPMTILTLATLTAGSAAYAQSEPQRRIIRERPPVVYAPQYVDPYGRSAGPVCVPWCRNDQNPCDPPEFKAADGRCNDD